MDLFSRALVQYPLDSFPIDILNPNERGCWAHFGIGTYPCVSYDSGNTVILYRCDHQGPTPVYQGIFPEKENWCQLGCLSSWCSLRNLSGGHGVIGPEHVRGGVELSWRCRISGRAALALMSWLLHRLLYRDAYLGIGRCCRGDMVGKSGHTHTQCTGCHWTEVFQCTYTLRSPFLGFQ